MACAFRGDSRILEGRDFDLALADFAEAIRLGGRFAADFFLRRMEPTNVQARFIRGRLHSSAWRNDLVLADFDEAIRLHPGFAEFYWARARLHIDMGEYALAIADLEALLRFEPDHPLAEWRMENVRRWLGQ